MHRAGQAVPCRSLSFGRWHPGVWREHDMRAGSPASGHSVFVGIRAGWCPRTFMVAMAYTSAALLELEALLRRGKETSGAGGPLALEQKPSLPMHFLP